MEIKNGLRRKETEMKREIKFRGKSYDGVWEYGDYQRFGEECYVDSVKIDPDTFGQFTGLKDKEGNDIYEGDIVKWDDMSGGKYWRFAVVRIGPDIMFDCSPVKSVCGVPNSTDYVFQYGRFQYQLTHNFLTVIGNIHESDTDIIIR